MYVREFVFFIYYMRFQKLMCLYL